MNAGLESCGIRITRQANDCDTLALTAIRSNPFGAGYGNRRNTAVTQNEIVKTNPAVRCYHCKRIIFGAILRQAEADHYSLLIDGTNASDVEEARAGMRAIRQMRVRSPLRELSRGRKTFFLPRVSETSGCG